MRKPFIEEYVFYQGEKLQVEFYFTEKGDLPAKEYFDSLDIQPKVKLLALVKYIADNGRLFDETKFRIVEYSQRIYEFKPMAERFFAFFAGGRLIIISNAYRKKGQKVDRRELSRAIALKQDYQSRVEGGQYYENSQS
jgi:hypothetical protein